MSWTMHSFFTGSPPAPGELPVGTLPGFRLGAHVDRLDRLTPTLEWWTVPVRGGMLDEVVHVTGVRLHPGRRVALRAPEWSIQVTEALTAGLGGFGGVYVADRAQGAVGRGLAFAGRLVEAVVGDGEGIRLDAGRPPGVDDSTRVRGVTEAPNQAVWVHWLEAITGLTTFDIDQARVRRPPRRHLRVLEPDGPSSTGWVPQEAPPRTVVGVFVDPESWEDAASELPEGWQARLRLTPPRLDLDSFKQRTVSYALLQHDGEADLDGLDALLARLRCDATAVEVRGAGLPIRWWDWEKGVPSHLGEVIGAADLVEVWGALAVALDTNPHVFSAPWPSSQ